MTTSTLEELKALVLPKLPYAYDALEPVISREIMELHYTKHHQAYVNNFNAAREKSYEAQSRQDLATVIALQPQIRFNGGGHINHSLFWPQLAPKGQGGEPSAELKKAIDTTYGSLEAMIERFNTMAAGIQGSGWGWVGYCKVEKRLMMEPTANQDPLSTMGLIPILGVDVWEHAYYIDYKNVRPAYLKAIWQIINWRTVSDRYAAATK